MKILYVARFDKGRNESEQAVEFALRSLGHAVTCTHQRDNLLIRDAMAAHDLLLFHKWHPPFRPTCPAVFWFPDRVRFDESDLIEETRWRTAWMQDVIPKVDLGFCTDGDWVAEDQNGKLVHLVQGADSRVMRLGDGPGDGESIFFAGACYGFARREWKTEMERRWGRRFHRGINCFGRELTEMIQTSRIVIAPPSPISDRYTSNRIFIVCGFGGFMLHPASALVAEMYAPDREAVYYGTTDTIHDTIASWLSRSADERWVIQQAAYRRTQAEHTYRHRVAQLLKICRERIDRLNPEAAG